MVSTDPMKKFSLTISMLLCLASLRMFGQGVPKAYEAVNYRGKVNGSLVRLMLANGYIGASSVKLLLPGKAKPLVFEPDAGVADADNRLKFAPINQAYSQYFILDHMQDAYEEIPAFITGNYFFNGEKVTVKFWLMKSRKG
jgi:hypothetical protein